MDSRRLRTFVTVAELGGVSAAAERLGYAQSSVSAQLRSLEAELGAPVVVRTHTGVELTQAGRRLLPLARQTLDLHDRMKRAVADDRPVLRIGALEVLAAEWLPDLVIALERGAAGPGTGCDVSLTVASRGDLVSRLAAGLLDVIFLFDNGAPGLGPSMVVARDRVVCVAAPDHPLAAQASVEVEQLVRSEFLVAEPGCTTQMLVDRFGRDLTRAAPVGMVTGSLAVLRKLLHSGRGVALLPYLAAAADIDAGNVVELPVDGAGGGLADIVIEARWRPEVGAAQAALAGLLGLAKRNPAPTSPPLQRAMPTAQ